MSAPHLAPYGVTVTRLRRGLVEDPYSGELTREGWDSPEATDIPGCAIWPMDPAESSKVDQDIIDASAWLSVPPGTDIGPADRVLDHTGRLWEVHGIRKDWHNPHTGTDRSTVRLQIVGEEF